MNICTCTGMRLEARRSLLPSIGVADPGGFILWVLGWKCGPHEHAASVPLRTIPPAPRTVQILFIVREFDFWE